MMSSRFRMPAVVGALVGALAYPPGADASAKAVLPQAVAAHIRQARVELYCGHDDQVQAQVRAALAQLREDARGTSPALATLASAAWLARTGSFEAAGAALDRALGQLEA